MWWWVEDRWEHTQWMYMGYCEDCGEWSVTLSGGLCVECSGGDAGYDNDYDYNADTDDVNPKNGVY